ncbi:MAG TPA: carboxypeptidase-like regulatory domain-containing protein, partial [bacterium]|nr:carboxypeptidase-like regulatory domain-containing protein [bacterium]
NPFGQVTLTDMDTRICGNRFWIAVIAICVLLCVGAGVRANSTTVIVRVSDDTGMPLDGVAIRMTKWSTDCKRKNAPNRPVDGTSTPSGLAWFRQIPSGSYRIEATRDGFSPFRSRWFSCPRNRSFAARSVWYRG